MKLTIGHLYPDLLNLYGDRGNIQCLMRRCQWRGIEAETIAFELGDKIDFSRLDIVLSAVAISFLENIIRQIREPLQGLTW